MKLIISEHTEFDENWKQINSELKKWQFIQQGDLENQTD